MTIILSAQILVPCADKVSTANKGKVLITQASHQQNETRDDCSPLCYCFCCSSYSVIHSFISLSTINPANILQHVAEYLPKAIQKVAIPIWQPPQLNS